MVFPSQSPSFARNTMQIECRDRVARDFLAIQGYDGKTLVLSAGSVFTVLKNCDDGYVLISIGTGDPASTQIKVPTDVIARNTIWKQPGAPTGEPAIITQRVEATRRFYGEEVGLILD